MKNPIFNFKIVLASALFIASIVSAQAKDAIERTKTITKEFEVSKDTKIFTSNHLGNITIRTWDIGKAKIEAFVKVKAKKEESIDEFLDHLNIQIKDNKSKNLIINTKLPLISNICMPCLNEDSERRLRFRDGTVIKVTDYEVNYILTVPVSNPLNMKSSFHDIIFENDIHGQTSIELTSGDLIGKNFTNNLNLRLNFSDAKLDQVENINLKMTSSKLELNQAKNIDIDSRFSDFMIKRANKITSNTTSCDMNINIVKSISGESRYGTVVVDHLIERFYLKGLNTSITINQIKNEFQEIHLHNSSFSSLKLHLKINLNTNLNSRYNLVAFSTQKTNST